MRNWSRAVMLLIVGLANYAANAQVGQSPFSINGIGDISNLAQANQFGMGEVGIASPTPFHINNMNPALLTYNKLSTFQMGVAADNRSITSDLVSQNNGGASLNNLVFAFPLANERWTMSIGLMPFSNVNYNVQVVQQVEDTPIPLTSSFEGEGGLVQAYWSHGIKLGNGFSLGLKGSYIFGSIENISSTFVGYSRSDLLDLIEQDVDTLFFSSYNTNFTNQNSFGDVTLGGGLHYRYQKGENTFFNVGLTYDPATNIKGSTTTFFSRTDESNARVNGSDSTNINEQGAFRLPHRYGFGITYEKLLKYTIALDINFQQWSKAREFDGSSEGFDDAIRIALGGEWIPNVTSVDSYFQRISYRLGFNFEQSPYLVQDERINELGINFGLSLPVGQGSSFDIGVKLGQRGNLNNNPIRERYVKALIGITINDRWFVRRRYD